MKIMKNKKPKSLGEIARTVYATPRTHLSWEHCHPYTKKLWERVAKAVERQIIRNLKAEKNKA